MEDIEAEVFAVVEYFSNTKVLSASQQSLVPLVAILETKMKSATRRPSSKRVDIGNISKDDIVNLHAKLIKYQEKSTANQRRWNMLLDNIIRLQVEVCTCKFYNNFIFIRVMNEILTMQINH